MNNNYARFYVVFNGSEDFEDEGFQVTGLEVCPRIGEKLNCIFKDDSHPEDPLIEFKGEITDIQHFFEEDLVQQIRTQKIYIFLKRY